MLNTDDLRFRAEMAHKDIRFNDAHLLREAADEIEKNRETIATQQSEIDALRNALVKARGCVDICALGHLAHDDLRAEIARLLGVSGD